MSHRNEGLDFEKQGAKAISTPGPSGNPFTGRSKSAKVIDESQTIMLKK